MQVLIHYWGTVGQKLSHIFNICVTIGPLTLFLEFFPREQTELYKQEVDHSIFIIEKIGNTIKIQYSGLVKS